jgi:hypothetical protein
MLERSDNSYPQDERLSRWFGATPIELELPGKPAAKDVSKRKFHVVFDTEIIGNENPVFLCCTEVVETGERHAFWQHMKEPRYLEGAMFPEVEVNDGMERMKEYFAQPDITFVSFNGIGFDTPVMSAAASGVPTYLVKRLATQLIEDTVSYWDAHKSFDFKPMKFDHIDISEVAPGVRISLKAYAGRMGYPTMQDMPIPHDVDPTPDQYPMIEEYCFNDCGVTKALFLTQQTELDLRREISAEHNIDVRSKSDAQVAEAVLKKVCGLGGNSKTVKLVRYTAPEFIKTDSPLINDIIAKMNAHEFTINMANGQLESPDFLKEPVKIGCGSYQLGVGGVHSTHDEVVCVWATEYVKVSDVDVASYYPKIMLEAGFMPKFEGNKGELFIEAYRKIYNTRVAAKRAGNKKVSNSLKILLNGTFGKLGSKYAAFYSPDLLLAVTLTGQLNLICLIHELEKQVGVLVQSANTDGICIVYPPDLRDFVLDTVQQNSTRTGFEYEETSYGVIALANVNNYIAITNDADVALISPTEQIAYSKQKGGKAKRKGLFASTDPKENPLYLMKNPTMEVCSNLAVDYLRDGTHPRDGIAKYTNMKDYVAIRAVKGGGIQFDHFDEVDNWVLVEDKGTKDNVWFSATTGKSTIRKSKPHPVEIGAGGEPFGRVARWYMTTDKIPPISYVGSGNNVPKTEGARVCMTLPTELPKDIDFDWYVKESLSMLKLMGVDVS